MTLCFWQVTWLLSKRAHGKRTKDCGHFAEFAILRLEFIRKIVPFNQRRIFKLELSLCPLFPCLSWIHYRIFIYLLMLFQEIGHIFRIHHFLQILQKHRIIDIPIMILSSKFLIFLWAPYPLFCSYKQQQCNFIVSRKDSEFYSCQTIRSNEFIIGSMLKQIPYYPIMIPFHCSHQRNFTSLGWIIDICFTILNKKFSHFQISIIGCSIKWSHFGIFSQFLIQQLWSFGQQLFNIRIVLSINVIQEVLSI